MWMGGTRKITSEEEDGWRVALRAGYRVLRTHTPLRPFRLGSPDAFGDLESPARAACRIRIDVVPKLPLARHPSGRSMFRCTTIISLQR